MVIQCEPTLVVAAIIGEDSASKRHFLIVRRGPNQSGAGFWEFPGGKVESSEDPKAALVREIQEELAMDIEIQALLGERDFTYPERLIRLRVYLCSASSRKLQLIEHDDFKWLEPQDIDPDELSPADRPFVDLLRQHYGSR